MTHAVAKLVDEFAHLSARERTEFLTLAVQPGSREAEDLTEDDISAIAAQTFSRIDAEEEEDGREG